MKGGLRCGLISLDLSHTLGAGKHPNQRGRLWLRLPLCTGPKEASLSVIIIRIQPNGTVHSKICQFNVALFTNKDWCKLSYDIWFPFILTNLWSASFIFQHRTAFPVVLSLSPTHCKEQQEVEQTHYCVMHFTLSWAQHCQQKSVWSVIAL